MAENKQAQTDGQNKDLDIKALLAAQAKEFEDKIKAQAEANEKQLEALATRNNELATELANLKTNTAEENELLGERIAAIKNGADDTPKYNPYKESILYKVENTEAGITTIMTGDEVQGIIGSIDKHLTKKLINGEKTVEKHPYKITLVEGKMAVKV